MAMGRAREPLDWGPLDSEPNSRREPRPARAERCPRPRRATQLPVTRAVQNGRRPQPRIDFLQEFESIPEDSGSAHFALTSP